MAAQIARLWPSQYFNRETNHIYKPHNAQERAFVYDDLPTNVLLKGGEGGGKSVAGIIKDLERLRRGMSGIMVSPDLPHFKRSLWPEFQRWCPWDCVVERERHRSKPDWEPHEPFTLHFINQTALVCGGIDDPTGWEGPNVSFAHLDEMRRAKTPAALKVLKGRVRIPGPQGEPPQLFGTTTPAKHWMWEYFGPVSCRCTHCHAEFAGEEAYSPQEYRAGMCRSCHSEQTLTTEDPQVLFKLDAYVATLQTIENAENLSPDFVAQRSQGLTEKESALLLRAEWEDIETGERFLPSMQLWDACQAHDLPPVDTHTPLVVALDAGVSNDCFALIAVSRWPPKATDGCAIRLVREWRPAPKRPLDFDAIEQEITAMLSPFSVAQITYDKYQLHQMAGHFKGRYWVKEFDQQRGRLIADKALLDLIFSHKLVHDGNPELRRAIDNADRQTDAETHKLRIVKRTDPQKVDLAVAASMAAFECLRLNL